MDTDAYACPACDAVDTHVLDCPLDETERTYGFGSPEATAVQRELGGDAS